MPSRQLLSTKLTQFPLENFDEHVKPILEVIVGVLGKDDTFFIDRVVL